MSVDSMYQSANKPLPRLPQGGGAKTILIPSLALETQHAIRQKRNQAHTLSIWRGANGHADQSRQSGRGPFPPPFGVDKTESDSQQVAYLNLKPFVSNA